MNLSKITSDDYAKAVEALVILAQDTTGGSRVAAQVVLSAYNGSAFQVDIAGLCGVLDEKYFTAALILFIGRRNFGKEPHQMVKNGDRIFKELWTQWEKLHVDNRWKPPCSNCDGLGTVAIDPQDLDRYDYVTCPVCNGRRW